jgi:xanthine dehydrogenase YagS FAD-binding subunit
MRHFEYRRATTPEGAASSARGAPAADFIAGGTNLTDYMTLDVARPGLLIDINHLPEQFARIDADETRLRLGALVRMAEAEDHPLVRRRYPVIQQALALAASRQIRNMATLGGNVLQRTRCEYFREPGFACNKREAGSGCAALEGLNRLHAVLGTSDSCIAAYAGDFAQALIALDASVATLGGASGPRSFPFAQLRSRWTASTALPPRPTIPSSCSPPPRCGTTVSSRTTNRRRTSTAFAVVSRSSCAWTSRTCAW